MLLEKEVLKKVGITLALIAVLIVVGAWVLYFDFGDWRSAIYQAVSLVIHTQIPRTRHAAWSFVLSFLGGILVLYIVITIVELFYHGKLRKSIGEVRIMNTLKKLENHYIICGGGKVGKTVAEELMKNNKDYVIIEKDSSVANDLKNKGFIVLEGDSLNESVLRTAKIHKAKALISCLKADGDNLLQIITAKALNPELKIIARVENPEFSKKFIAAGATDVVLLAVIAGKKMAESAKSLDDL